ncbi:MAG: hypothetical protein JNM51_01810 [Bacteroidia bacterium]|nr:hypothetical protein [Bacteroidia bacterium]
MTPEEFVKAFRDEKESFLDIYFERKPNPYEGIGPKSDVAEMIKQLNLDKEQKEILFKIVEGSLRDFSVTLLYALDGAATLGKEMQQCFDLRDEDGNQLTGGELEGYSGEYFQ